MRKKLKLILLLYAILRVTFVIHCMRSTEDNLCALDFSVHETQTHFPTAPFETKERRTKPCYETRIKNHNMHRRTIFLLSILLASLPTALYALNIPSSLTLLPQNNLTLASHLTLNNNHNNHPNLTNYLTPTCYFITTDPPMRALSNTKCAFLADDVCSDLALHGPRAHSTWIWSQVSGCALAYYLPPDAIRPWRSTCEDGIFGAIRRDCAADPAKNAGSVNVGRLPGFGGGDDGTAVWEVMGRYLVAPERLTL